ncbi:MAG: hypothetical protein ACK5JD_11935 [Mangrovibacterium sp.]
MANKPKNLKLRAFRIENNEITQSNSGILNNITNKLQGSIAETRRMQLNSEDIKREEDLISDFSISQQKFVSGVVLRITHAEDVPNIPDTFLKHEKISINELENIEAGTSIIYKEHYYFLLNNDFVITNLQSNINIKRLQVYINWLLEKERASMLYEFTPIVVSQNETKLSDIKKITVKDKTVNFMDKQDDTGHKKFALSLDLLTDLIKDVSSLDKIIDNNIVSAELLIKFTKPRKMSEADYQKIMGAYMKPISETDDISFSTKKNGVITGSDILKTKSVDIELTETNKINEPQLYQEMEKFLNELINENNN